MADHVIEFVRTRQASEKPEWAQCSCGQNSGWRLKRDGDGGTEEWAREHRDFIRRVKAALGRRTPGLADQRDFYQKMADDPLVPASDRVQWRALADELTSRIEGGDGSTQESLF